jgi:hypothetical protein
MAEITDTHPSYKPDRSSPGHDMNPPPGSIGNTLRLLFENTRQKRRLMKSIIQFNCEIIHELYEIKKPDMLKRNMSIEKAGAHIVAYIHNGVNNIAVTVYSSTKRKEIAFFQLQVLVLITPTHQKHPSIA